MKVEKSQIIEMFLISSLKQKKMDRAKSLFYDIFSQSMENVERISI